jgi:hypothetical protein
VPLQTFDAQNRTDLSGVALDEISETPGRRAGLRKGEASAVRHASSSLICP